MEKDMLDRYAKELADYLYIGTKTGATREFFDQFCFDNDEELLIMERALDIDGLLRHERKSND